MNYSFVLALARIISLYFIASGIVFIINPKSLKRYIAFWLQGKRLYAVGVSRFISGGILLLSFSQCRIKWTIFILGVLNILAGLPYFIRGIEGMKAMLSFWEQRPPKAVRILGIAYLALGLIIIYSV